MKEITIYSTYSRWEDGADEPTVLSEETETYDIEWYQDGLGGWNEDDTDWIPATVVDTAWALLTGHGTHFYAGSSSSSPGEVACGDNPWYDAEPEILFRDGTELCQSAHLSGFTPEEIKEIHELLFPPR